MNRAERRKMQKQQKKITRPSYRGLTHEAKLERLFQNGISLDDLKQEWSDGFHAGFAQASPATTKTIYAAIVLALHEELKFGRDRCQKLLQRIDRIVIESLTSQEAIDAVYEQVGLHLDFADPIDPIKQTDDAKPWRKPC